MPRPPTAVGTYGTIRVNGEPGHYVARAWFRDLDGKARQVERSGPTKTKAKDALKLALRDRARTATGINGDTRIREIAPEWLGLIDAAVNAGERSPSTAEQYRRLARTPVSHADLKKYVRRVLQIEDEPAPGTRILNIADRILELAEAGRRNDLPAVRGTLWAGYNAVTEHLGYSRGRTPASRLDSLWFGKGACINKQALQVALDMAA